MTVFSKLNGGGYRTTSRALDRSRATPPPTRHASDRRSGRCRSERPPRLLPPAALPHHERRPPPASRSRRCTAVLPPTAMLATFPKHEPWPEHYISPHKTRPTNLVSPSSSPLALNLSTTHISENNGVEQRVVASPTVARKLRRRGGSSGCGRGMETGEENDGDEGGEDEIRLRGSYEGWGRDPF